MELKKKISSNKPRENSGSRSSNRFDYQKDWAIIKLIELHKSKKDYLLVMDYFDDVVVFDSAEMPKNLSFYQVKTRGNNWTVNRMLERKKGKDGPLLSILGKMYECKMQFSNHTLSLNFVTNAKFNVQLKEKDKGIDKETICFNDINEAELENIVKQIRDEHLLDDEPEFSEFTFFHKVNLSIDDRETYVTGKLSHFLEELNPKGKFKISLVYKTLFDEVKRKNNYEGEISDFESLAKYKGISKPYFTSIVSEFTKDNKVEKAWQMIQTKLNFENVPMLETFELSNTWEIYHLEKMDLANLRLQELKKTISKIVEKYRSEPFELFYSEFVTKAYEVFHDENNEELYSEHYIKVIIISEYFKL